MTIPLTPIGQTSRLTGISIDTLRRWSRDGSIHCWRDSRGWRLFDLHEVMARIAPRVEPQQGRPSNRGGPGGRP